MPGMQINRKTLPRWSVLNPVPSPDWLPKALAEKVKSVNDEIADINARRQRHDETRATFQASDPTTMDASDLVANGQSIAAEEVALLQAELEVRGMVDLLLGEIEEAKSAAHDKAAAKATKAESKLREDLISIGYTEGAVVPGGPQSIVPVLFQHHPAVVTARADARSLLMADYDAPRRTNEAEASKVRQRLAEIRDRLARV